MSTVGSQQIALLIDCDNVSHQTIEFVLNELAQAGTVNVRHAYGDWNSKSLEGWAKELDPHAIEPIQQIAYTKAKNATDIAMVIGAMDLLHNQQFDILALMTSDSDFTPLAMRVRESKRLVYGFGEQKKKPQPFKDACSKFVCIDTTDAKEMIQEGSKNKALEDWSLIQLLKTAVKQTMRDDGWSNLATVGNYMSNKSSFSPRDYGFAQLKDLIVAVELFEIRVDDLIIYVQIKSPSASIVDPVTE